MQVVWTCWRCVGAWVTGLGACSADSAQTGCCGCLAQWQRDNKAATQGEGTDRGPRMSRVNCPPKTLPLFFPKILSCFKICCPCTFHVSAKRRWWCLQHCLGCVCVYDVRGCLHIMLACLGVCFYLRSAVYRFSTGFKLKSNHSRTEVDSTCAMSLKSFDSLPLSLLLSICLYSASQGWITQR